VVHHFREWGQVFHRVPGESLDVFSFSFHFQDDSFGGIFDETREVEFLGGAVEERAEAYALDNAFEYLPGSFDGRTGAGIVIFCHFN